MDEEKHAWKTGQYENIKPIIQGITTAIAILCIAYLEAPAIQNGIDGTLFGIVIAAIAGLGGYSIKDILTVKK
ncbi:MAG: hypothetical protein KAW47_00955 [Thermoplasmatales archaeon]|nr:hypothetical protein [Thermoplasmatales archaeon]